MCRAGFAFVCGAIIATCLLFPSTLKADDWTPWHEPVRLNDADGIGVVKLARDYQGGWVALWKEGLPDSPSVILSRLKITSKSPFKVKKIRTQLDLTRVKRIVGLEVSEKLGLIAVTTRESVGEDRTVLKVYFYNLRLKQVGSPLNLGESWRKAVFSSDGKLVAVGGLRLRKYDIRGEPITGPVRLKAWDGQYPSELEFVGIWGLEDGKTIVAYLYIPGICCYGTCSDVIFRTLSSELTLLKEPVYIYGDKALSIKLEKDGDFLTTWTSVYPYFFGFGIYWLDSYENRFQRYDSFLNPIGTPVTFGATYSSPDMNEYGPDMPEYVAGERTFIANPSGGFAMINLEEYPLDLQMEGKVFYARIVKTLNFYVYDGEGNLIDGPVEFYDKSPENLYFREGIFTEAGDKYLALWSEEGNLWARVIREHVNTPEGMDVSYADDAGVTVIFDEVSRGGDTEVTVEGDGPGMPGDFRTISPPAYYEITTDADDSGNVEVCIDYDESRLANPENLLRLFHWDGHWEDITTSRDTEANEVCGVTESLSTFTLASQAHDSDFGLEGGCSAATGNGQGSNASHILAVLVLLLPGLLAGAMRIFPVRAKRGKENEKF